MWVTWLQKWLHGVLHCIGGKYMYDDSHWMLLASANCRCLSGIGSFTNTNTVAFDTLKVIGYIDSE